VSASSAAFSRSHSDFSDHQDASDDAAAWDAWRSVARRVDVAAERSAAVAFWEDRAWERDSLAAQSADWGWGEVLGM
jgi:hypothetical protein